MNQNPAPRAKSSNLRPLSGLLPYLKRYRMQVALAFVALLAATGTTLAIPIAVRRAIDYGFSSDHPLLINQYFMTMLVIVAGLAMASAARFYYVTWLGERIVVDLRRDVFEHLLSLSASFYDAIRTGEVVARLTADTTQIKSAFASAASIVLRNLLLLAGSIILMALTSPRLSGLTLLAIPLIILPLILFGRRVRELSRRTQDALAESAAMAQETLGAIAIVQSFNQEETVNQQFAAENETLFAAARHRTRARAFLTAGVIFLSLGAIVAVLWLGARDVLEGKLTAGTLGQFLLYATLAASAIGELSQVWGEIQLAAGATERLTELLATAPQIVPPAAPAVLTWPGSGNIAFKDVSFAYAGRGDQQALRNVSFSVASGQTLAIVGPSGAGKSTIFNLLLRAYEIDAGAIELDGLNIADADPREVRRHFAVVPQEGVIFSTTILENIRFGRPAATETEVMSAAVAAGVNEFASELTAGLKSTVGERGVMLSGGQRQRISIARALLRNAPVLLLDEATSALDAESERAVQAAVERLKKDRTTLVIAHRLATVSKADSILVLEEGGVVAQGSHHSLLNSDGLYARLARLQFLDRA